MTPGDRYERDLVNAFDETEEFVAMRCPSSGSATSRDLPDVIALRPDVLPVVVDPETGEHTTKRTTEALAIELKATQATTAYADSAEVVDLMAFAERAGAIPLLGAKFKRPGKRTPFYLVAPNDCRRTPEGNYGVPVTDAEDRARYLVWSSTDTKPAVLREP